MGQLTTTLGTGMKAGDTTRTIHIVDEKVDSAALFNAQKKELVIKHQEHAYCLRVTSNGKLILTK